MAWLLKFSKEAEKQLLKLDRAAARRIVRYLEEHALTGNPRTVGKSLKGNLADYWRYRVGSYRVLCQIEDGQLVVLVVEVGHRKDIYE